MKILSPSLTATCPCGSGKQYKRCCFLKGGIVIPYKNQNMVYNKKYNRYESAVDHHYKTFSYRDFKYGDSKPYNGKIKCRLVHVEGKSIIIPDFLFIRNGWIQPLHFTAPILCELDEKTIVCDFFIDIQNAISLKVRFYNTNLLETFSDKSQLFSCELFGPSDIEDYICGHYSTIEGKIHLTLFHHTNEKGYDGIINSKSIWSSKWNYKGNKECLNYHFAYFTHIPEIKYANDLITVAMSAEGEIDYMIDSFSQPKILTPDYRKEFEDFIYTAEVYRSTSADRNKAIKFYIPVENIDVKHIYMHHQDNLVFYEICFPYIHRIKLKPNSVLPFNDEFKIENSSSIFNSGYSIIGDARYKAGLAAPFEEDDTKFIFKIEDCGAESIPDFWFSHSNKDLFSGKNIEVLITNMKEDNPTATK